jgi:hypothetical protein
MTDSFQSRASTEGRAAQDIAQRILDGAGFTDLRRNVKFPGLGATVNFVGKDQAGASWYFDVSGAFTSGRAGLIRTDTVWKTLGRASVLNMAGHQPLVFLTTNLPKPGSVGEEALLAASDTYFDALEIPAEASKARLRQYSRGGVKNPLPGILSAELIYPSLTNGELAFGSGTTVAMEEVSTFLPTSKGGFNTVALPHRLQVIVPSKDANGQVIEARRRLTAGNRIVKLMSEAAGGCTGMQAVGAWVDPIGGIMHEQVSTIESYSSTPFSDELVVSVVSIITRELEQHTAAIVLDETMYQVTPSA